MNRLVIIGNGFDLAHGLPTGYCNFIDDYWQNVIKTISIEKKYSDGFFTTDVPILINSIFEKDLWNRTVKDYNSIFIFLNRHPTYKASFSFTNEFFRKISNETSMHNWVDIENAYYKLLKECLKKNDNQAIIELNKEFDEVKSLLQQYLIKNIEESFEFKADVAKEFLNIFEVKKYKGNSLEKLYAELPKKDENEFENFFEKERQSLWPHSIHDFDNYKKSLSIENYFLSFNYTSTVKEYNQIIGNELENLIEIHGSLVDGKNPINFGFGDEMDKHYQEIEEKNDNEYLRNIKSFQYLHTSNYKRLLDLIDSEKFQVYIMGHSCGLSDRTLLNTVFEHQNCISIKVFYHQREDGTDNYTEITQNISRHFNKKKLMREKIVNKTLCQPLPQIQLPKKQPSSE